LDEDIQEAYRLDAILTIVDSKHIAQHLDEEKPDGVENESVEQIAFADVIILNKTDLVSAEQLTAVKDKIKAINTYSAVFETRFSVVPLRDVLWHLCLRPHARRGDGRRISGHRCGACSAAAPRVR